MKHKTKKFTDSQALDTFLNKTTQDGLAIVALNTSIENGITIWWLTYSYQN